MESFVKIIMLIVMSIIPQFIFALTLDEATLYGSRIIICNNEYIKYWTLNKKYQKNKDQGEYQIFDRIKKRFYKLEDCKLYKCSPAPDRMYKCMLPDK